MWKQVLSPTLTVIALFLFTGGAATFYMTWLEQSYERDLSEHVASIRSANRLERIIWRMVSTWPSTSEVEESARFEQVWRELELELNNEVEVLREVSHSFAQREMIALIVERMDRFEQVVEHYLAKLPAQKVNELISARNELYQLSDELAVATSKFRQANQTQLDREAARRDAIRIWVLLALASMLLLGPALGIYAGWRISRELNRSFAKILVTLSDDETESKQDLGSVAVYPDADLGELQHQAEVVVCRLRQAHAELQEVKRDVIRSERLAAVGELASAVAHELRNPLTSVKLLLQHASRPQGPQRLSDSQWQLILEEIERIERTIQGLLDFSRPHPLRRSQHDLRDTVQRALNLIDVRASGAEVAIVRQFAGQSCVVDGDAEQLHQMCLNLLINAIQAMPSGGTLTVSVSPCDNQLIELRVADTGEGIAEDLFPRLFAPFATTRENGTGLGLAISRRIVLTHGGTIAGENSPAGGAIFTVQLPAAGTRGPAAIDNEKEMLNGNLAGGG